MKITQSFLKEILSYNQETGLFTWNKRELGDTFKNKRSVNVFNALFAGEIAGNISRCERSATEYLHIKILGSSYKAHRLAFIYMTGSAPKEVDHLDHNGLNNKWSNLRASNSRDNAKNMPKQKSNKTGVIGVNWHKAAGKWQARAVNNEGVRVDLGRFDNFEDAVAARRKHETLFGYYENRAEVK